MTVIKIVLSFGLFCLLICCEKKLQLKSETEINSNINQSHILSNTNTNNLRFEEPLPSKYIACGCGCCSETTPIKKCLYHAKNDDLRKIIQADRDQKQNTKLCSLVGCAQGIEYKYCD